MNEVRELPDGLTRYQIGEKLVCFSLIGFLEWDLAYPAGKNRYEKLRDVMGWVEKNAGVSLELHEADVFLFAAYEDMVEVQKKRDQLLP